MLVTRSPLYTPVLPFLPFFLILLLLYFLPLLPVSPPSFLLPFLSVRCLSFLLQLLFFPLNSHFYYCVFALLSSLPYCLFYLQFWYLLHLPLQISLTPTHSLRLLSPRPPPPPLNNPRPRHSLTSHPCHCFRPPPSTILLSPSPVVLSPVTRTSPACLTSVPHHL